MPGNTARSGGPGGGAVTFIQRFGDALNLNVHFHTLLLDGVYERYGEPGMHFRALPPPHDDEVRRVVERVAGRVARLMERRGFGTDADPSDADLLAVAQPHLAGLAAASVRGLAPGGWRPARRGDCIDPEDLSAPATPRCAAAMGFTLHADVAVPARDRRRLERLCRYVARPPVATDRLERLPDGRLLYHLRHRWRDGTTQIVFEPHQLLAHLVPLIPAPRAHQVRYHGVLAPCTGWRDRVVPLGRAPARPHGPRAALHRNEETGPGGSAGNSRSMRRYPWANLLRRVFALDILECPDCGGRMRVLAAIHPPDATRAILECLGLPSRAPPDRPYPARARAHGARAVRLVGRKRGTGLQSPPNLVAGLSGEGGRVSTRRLATPRQPCHPPAAQLESPRSPVPRPVSRLTE